MLVSDPKGSGWGVERSATAWSVQKVKPQILETPVRQPIDMGARQWNAWWVALQRDVGLVAPEPADRPAPAPASCLESY